MTRNDVAKICTVDFKAESFTRVFPQMYWKRRT